MRAFLVLSAITLAGAGPPQPEARLEAAWRALHPGEALPKACAHPDPVRILAADLDGEAGIETALASLRFGVVLLGADGRALAGHALGCVEGRGADERSQVTGLEAVRARSERADQPLDLVVRARRVGHCGWATEWRLLGRRGAILERLLAVDEEGAIGCAAAPVTGFRAPVEVLGPGRLRAGSAIYRLRSDGKFEHQP